MYGQPQGRSVFLYIVLFIYIGEHLWEMASLPLFVSCVCFIFTVTKKPSPSTGARANNTLHK